LYLVFSITRNCDFNAACGASVKTIYWVSSWSKIQ
jgi:hypothetical protein